VDTEFEKTGSILTPTLKIKRKTAREYFAEHIKRIYQKTDEKI